MSCVLVLSGCGSPAPAGGFSTVPSGSLTGQDDRRATSARLQAAWIRRDEAGFVACFENADGPRAQAERLFANFVALGEVSISAGPERLEVTSTVAGSTSRQDVRIDWSEAGIERIRAEGSEPIWLQGELASTRHEGVTLLRAGDASSSPWLAAAGFAERHLSPGRLGPLATGWTGALVIEVPTDSLAFARLLGWTAADAQGTAAVAFEDGRPGSAVRIAVNPDLARLDAGVLDATFVHEAVHVATRSPQRPGTPAWVTEGFAEAEAVAAVPDQRRARDDLVRAALRAGVPSALPSDEAFSGEPDSVRTAYALASVAVEALEDELGRRRALQELAALSGLGSPTVAPAQLLAWYRTRLATLG